MATEPQPSGFEAVLAEVEATFVGPRPDSALELPLMGAAIRAFREALMDADNMGRTGDERDVYALIDRLVGELRAAYPGVKCTSGCSGCCDSETAVFDVSEEEWGRIVDHVQAQWPAERRHTFFARFMAGHGDRLTAYRLLGLVWHFEPLADRYWAKHRYQCPFLEGGRCSIYAARPLACRMYGYFALRTRWYKQPSIYACRMQADYFSEVRDRGALFLPSVNAVAARVRRYSRGKGWRMARFREKIVPLWIATAWPMDP